MPGASFAYEYQGLHQHIQSGCSSALPVTLPGWHSCDLCSPQHWSWGLAVPTQSAPVLPTEAVQSSSAQPVWWLRSPASGWKITTLITRSPALYTRQTSWSPVFWLTSWTQRCLECFLTVISKWKNGFCYNSEDN